MTYDASVTNQSLSRRGWLHSAAAGAVLSLATPSSEAADDKVITKGRIKQSIVFWCFNIAGEKWDMAKTCSVARTLGCKSIELADPTEWATIKKNELTCAIAPNGMPGAPFMRGLNNVKFHDEVIARTQKNIDACADFGCPSIIAFSGYKWVNPEDPKSGEISRDDGAKNSVAGLKKLAAYAEKKNITICLEHLNTRDDTHPMKGHPGYQGDDLDWMAAIIRKVGSPRVKLLFDIYHVQVMHGDVLRRLEQNKDIIGHVHTAGNPGRGELDDKQEINYPPILRKLIDIGYQGYVGQEFIPTRNPQDGLREAVKLCDV